MPITEVPNSPPPVKDPQPDYELEGRRNTSDYGDLGTDELVQRINELEDERRAARIREGIWIALLVHAVAVLLWIFGPRYIWHEPVVVNPALKGNKDFTYFSMPADALRQPRARSSAPLVHPHVDQKTLEHFQAQRKAAPAPQAPMAPQQKTPLPVPQQPEQPVQQAQQQPPPPQPTQTPVPQPAPRQQAQTSSQPAQQTPNPFKTNDSAGDMIRQAAKGAASGSGAAGTNSPTGAGGMGAGATILSDTMGVNFDPWLQRVIAATYRSWLPIIPISAKPPLNDQGKVSIKFDVLPNGSIRPGSMFLISPSGKVPLDRAAWAGIVGAGYPPLPAEFKGKSLTLGFGFYYNIPVDEK
jgi:outer membrane biosynthesis protein TonB